MITEADYQKALDDKELAQEVINAYHKLKSEAFQQRLLDNPIFTDDELVYSADVLCPCGHGIAYPKGCGSFHHWDCAGILKGIADKDAEHCGQQPFVMTDYKSELQTSANGRTTRGVFRPKPQPESVPA